MKFSYLGMSEPMNVVHEALMRYIVSYRRSHSVVPPLIAGGIFSSKLEEAAVFAAANEMAVYTSAADIINKSHIIFCFLPEKALKGLASSLRGHGITGKIFCHFNPAFDAEVLDFGSDNTYVSFFIPVYQHANDGIIPHKLFVEGYGRRFDEITYIAQILDIPLTPITREDKTLLLIAANLLNDFPTYIEQIAQKLMRISFYNNPELADYIFEKYKSHDYTINSYDPTNTANIRFVENQSDILKSIGLNDVSTLFASYLLAKTTKYNPDNEAMSRIADIARKLMKK